MINNLKKLAIIGHDKRQKALSAILEENNLPYFLQQGVINDRHTENVVVRIGEGKRKLVVGAHYDSVEGSTGANDNASGMCVIIEIAKKFVALSRAPDIDFVFFDFEETGGLGSRLYIKEIGADNIPAMINFDICGYGDSILVAPLKDAGTSPFSLAFDSKEVVKHNFEIIDKLPPGDDAVFIKAGILSLSIGLVEKCDVDAMKKLFSSKEQVPKEDFPSIIKTMHNGPYDKVDTVQPEAMKLVYEFGVSLVYATAKALK